MFETHQPRIAKFARANPENFAKVLTFVVVTIRNPLSRVPADMEDIADGRELPAVLWGFKARAVAEIQTNRDAIYWHCEDIWYHREDDDDGADHLVAYLSRVHGLGLAKAGFAVQLIYGVSGCLDTHNLERFSIPLTAFKARNTKTVRAHMRRVRDYHKHVKQCGGTRTLWNDWCEYLAQRAPNTYRNAEYVSALHCEALGLPA